MQILNYETGRRESNIQVFLLFGDFVCLHQCRCTKVGALVGVGAATMVSIKLGEKDYDTARLVLGNVIILNIIFGVGFTLVCLPFLEPILYALGGSPQTVPYAKDYMFVILIGNVFTHLYLGLNSVLRSSGYPEKAMWVTVGSVIMNAVLAALFRSGIR